MGNPKKNRTLVTQDSFKIAKFLAKNAFDSMPTCHHLLSCFHFNSASMAIAGKAEQSWFNNIFLQAQKLSSRVDQWAIL